MKIRPLPFIFSFLFFVFFLQCDFIALAQGNKQQPQTTVQPTPSPLIQDERPISVKTDLVTLTISVNDVYGRYVPGLTKEAFTIFDNNQQQEVTFFSDADAPASVGILFDVSGSMTGEKIVIARTALERFIKTSHPSDEYFLIGFNNRAQLLLDGTRDGEAVLNKLTLVQPKDNTALYDAAYLGVERVTRGAHQKKAILIISDGQDNSSRYSFNDVSRLLKESDIIVYATGIMTRRETGSKFGMLGQIYLDELTSVTGGKAFYPQTNIEMDEVFERIALELRHQYSVGYTPKDFEVNGKYRKVKVKVKPPLGFPRLTVRCREGYYAAPNTK